MSSSLCSHGEEEDMFIACEPLYIQFPFLSIQMASKIIFQA